MINYVLTESDRMQIARALQVAADGEERYQASVTKTLLPATIESIKQDIKHHRELAEIFLTNFDDNNTTDQLFHTALRITEEEKR